MLRSPDISPMEPQLIEKVTGRLDTLAKQAVAAAVQAEQNKQELLEHLRNLHGQVIPVKAYATQYNGGEGFKPYGETDPGSRGGWLAPDHYEVGEVKNWYDLGTQVTLRAGGMAFTVNPETIQQVSAEAIQAHRQQLEALPVPIDLDD